MPTYEFAAPLWRWEARNDSWYFVTVPQDDSDELRELPHPPRGFGSIKVRATIGSSTWSTSVFPDVRRSGCYVLPVKRGVRDAEGIGHDDLLQVTIETV
jgi:hypothetical protein